VNSNISEVNANFVFRDVSENGESMLLQHTACKPPVKLYVITTWEKPKVITSTNN
jgi:hypothetical protein